MQTLVEIASYPKCGNTWLRYIIAQQFELDVHHGIPDVHQQGSRTHQLVEWINIDSRGFGFYKSHIPDNSQLNPDSIICIYRHPLDVFLSSLNYFSIIDSPDPINGGRARSVDEINSEGEMDLYLDDYIDNLGANYFPSLLGAMSNYFKYVCEVMVNPKVYCVRYEDLFSEPEATFRTLLKGVMGIDELRVRHGLFQEVDKRTKNSGDPFYWKARAGNFLDMLSKKQIQRFEEAYQEELRSMGYVINRR